MSRWSLTIIFVILGVLISGFGYLSVQVMIFPGNILLLPAVPIIKLLNWESVFEFYHSGYSVDRFGIIKVVLIETVEFGLLGSCFDLFRHYRVKPNE